MRLRKLRVYVKVLIKQVCRIRVLHDVSISMVRTEHKIAQERSLTLKTGSLREWLYGGKLGEWSALDERKYK